MTALIAKGVFSVWSFRTFFLINTYVPNVKNDLSRLAERQEFDVLMRDKVRQLEETKPVCSAAI